MSQNGNGSSYVETERELDIIEEADVVVAGGGPGGIGAAIAAARGGAKTILIERMGTLGGTWTSGLLSAVMVNWSARGIFEEFRRRLEERGAWKSIEESWEYWGGAAPPEDPASYEGTYDAETAKLVLEEMVTAAGVNVIYFALVTGVFMSEDGRRVRGLIIESKEGRHVVGGRVFIDSSGDGDVCARAGANFAQGRDADGKLQPMTMIFKMDNVDTDRAQAYLRTDGGCQRAWQAAKARGEVTVPRENLVLNPAPKPGQWHFNCTRVIGYDGTKLRDVSLATIEARRQVSEVTGFLRKHIPGFENAILAETAPHIGVRETRRIKCDYTITGADIANCRKHEDVIARGNWPVDIHNPLGNGTEVVPLRNGAWYEVPYRSLTPEGLENVFVASRCIDTTHEGHAAVRATPQVCAIGEAAGAAAALMIVKGLGSTREINISELQETLRKHGALV